MQIIPYSNADGDITMDGIVIHLLILYRYKVIKTTAKLQTEARIPIHTRTVEWALIEIVILLTGIGDSLKRMADRP